MGSHRIGPARDNSLLKGAFAMHPQFPTCCLPSIHSAVGLKLSGGAGPCRRNVGAALTEPCQPLLGLVAGMLYRILGHWKSLSQALPAL